MTPSEISANAVKTLGSRRSWAKAVSTCFRVFRVFRGCLWPNMQITTEYTEEKTLALVVSALVFSVFSCVSCT
jgi:hypothetical protein